jgi:hypothetical protein
MSRTRLVLVSLLAVFALSAVTSTAASAATHQWIIGGTVLATGSKVEVAGGNIPTQQQQWQVREVGFFWQHYTCQREIFPPKGESSTLIGGTNGKAELIVEMRGCAVFEVNEEGVPVPLANCKVKEPVTAEYKGELTGAGELTLTVKSFKYTLENYAAGLTCATAAKYTVEGTTICPIPHYGVDFYAVVLACGPGGSKPTIKQEGTELTEPPQFYLPFVAVLASGGKWHST